VCLSVVHLFCCSICEQDYGKKESPDFIETWRYDWAYQSEEVINFWQWSNPRYGHDDDDDGDDGDEDDNITANFSFPSPSQNWTFIRICQQSAADLYDIWQNDWCRQKNEWIHYVLWAVRQTSGSGLIWKSRFECWVTFGWDVGLGAQSSRRVFREATCRIISVRPTHLGGSAMWWCRSSESWKSLRAELRRRAGRRIFLLPANFADEGEDFVCTSRSIAWELIPFVMLWASKG